MAAGEWVRGAGGWWECVCAVTGCCAVYTPGMCRNEIWAILLGRRSCFIKTTIVMPSIYNAPKLSRVHGRLYITPAITLLRCAMQ